MGLEAECMVRVGRKASTGKALLESESLIVRGDIHIEIPLSAVREVAVDGDALVVKTADQEARFELGAAAAERWARQIKEPKGLFEKLEVTSSSRVAVVDVRDPHFLAALRERTAGVAEGRVPEGVLVVFFGAETRESLRKIQLLRARMLDNGILWIVRPKASQAISESDVLEAARSAGLADTKVVAFSKTHTAHKCVVPVDQRGVARRRPPVLSIPPSTPLMQPKNATRRPPPAAAAKSAKAAKSTEAGSRAGKNAKAGKGGKGGRSTSKTAAKKHK